MERRFFFARIDDEDDRVAPGLDLRDGLLFPIRGQREQPAESQNHPSFFCYSCFSYSPPQQEMTCPRCSSSFVVSVFNDIWGGKHKF